MRSSTLADLADRYGLAVPTPIPAGARDWEAFQSRYDAARAAIRTVEDLQRVVTEAIRDNVDDGCAWLEIQLDPTSYAPLLGGFETVVEAALDAMKDAPCGLIIASSWARSGEHAEQLAQLAMSYDDVVGFGLSNDERRGDIDDFVAAMRIAADKRRVPHGGFYEGAWHVWECVTKLGANRVGHGITAMRDKETVALLAERQVALEVCPTSYPPLGVMAVEDLPLRELLNAGVPITLGSDDPLLFGANVTDQYLIAKRIGLDDTELAATAKHSIETSAAPADLKARTVAAIEEWQVTPEKAAGRFR